MENRSFEESPRGNRPRNPMDNPPGPSKPRADPSGESKDQKKGNIPPLARISDDEDDESPPAHIQRYMPKKKNIQDDLEDLEPPPVDPVPGPHDDRSNPELEAAARKRKQLRRDQLATEGPCHLRPDSPNVPPPPVPEPYPDPDHQIGQQGANADNPEQQGANADNPEQQGAVAGQQADLAADSGEQGAAEPGPGQQADNTTVRPLTWREICVSCCQTIQSFNFQFGFYTVLLVWTVLTALMGIMHVTVYCKMNQYLPWVMVAVASFATMTIVNRLCAIFYEKNFPNSSITCWWISVRVMELISWIGFSVQLGLFFMQIPSYNPKETPYCRPSIYRFNCVLIFLASTLMIIWIVVNVKKLIDWLKIVVRRRNENRNI